MWRLTKSKSDTSTTIEGLSWSKYLRTQDRMQESLKYEEVRKVESWTAGEDTEGSGILIKDTGSWTRMWTGYPVGANKASCPERLGTSGRIHRRCINYTPPCTTAIKGARTTTPFLRISVLYFHYDVYHPDCYPISLVLLKSPFIFVLRIRACLTKNPLCTPYRALVDFRRISGRYFASECVVNACLTVDTHSFPPSTPSKYYHAMLFAFPCLPTYLPMPFSWMRSRKFMVRILLFPSIPKNYLCTSMHGL